MGFPLAEVGLPENYPDLSATKQRKARLKVLTSWFDTSRPQVLCTDTEAYIRAHKLWCDFYMKPADINSHVYFLPDPEHKYDMLRLAMAPPIQPNEPAKAAIHAPRGTCKTITMVRESVSLMAVCRPNTCIVVSEFNSVRTGEEIQAIRQQIVHNERIHHDFGGSGVIYPKSRLYGDKWNESQLDFIHNRSVIRGVSVGSAHRGRHPHYWIIDDPQNEEDSHRSEARKDFFRWLFRSGLPMLKAGNRLTWIDTLRSGVSCIAFVLGESSTPQDEDEEQVGLESHQNFEDWRKKRFKYIYETEDGEKKSLWPEDLSVDGWEDKVRSIGFAAAMAEYQGEAVAEGGFAFSRDPICHGYMHCIEHEGRAKQNEYMLDLRSGVRQEWTAFVESLAVFAAVDIADSVAITSDPAACVFIGIDPGGVVYVLDAWIRRVMAHVLVEKVFILSDIWGCQRIGWEKAALQTVVFRMAQRLQRARRESGGSSPNQEGLENIKSNQKKERRIIGTLTPVLGHHEIRFLHLREFTDTKGIVHRPIKCVHRQHHLELMNQIDQFTDEGASGHDDAIDALEMVLRMAGKKRGRLVEEAGDPNDREFVKWSEAGYEIPRNCIPPLMMTEKMERERMEEAMVPVEPMLEVMPYA